MWMTPRPVCCPTTVPADGKKRYSMKEEQRMWGEERHLHEECGVFGVCSPKEQDVASLTYYGLFALQHRGQESAGIVVNDRGVFSTCCDVGLVSEVFPPQRLEALGQGNIAVGQGLRYPLRHRLYEKSVCGTHLYRAHPGYAGGGRGPEAQPSAGGGGGQTSGPH